MLESFSESERIAVIGLIASVSVAFLTFMGVVITNWTTIYVTRINKEQKETEEHQHSIIVPTSRSTQSTRSKIKFQIKPLWIPIVLAFGLFLTIIILLTYEHKRQQESEKHTYKSPDYYVDMGNQYAEMGNYSHAESLYRQALMLDDNDAHTHDKLSVALREQGKLEEALDENVAAVAMDSTVGEYHCNKGLTLQRIGNRKKASGADREAQGDYENAERAFQKAIEKEPTVAKYHFVLATVRKDMVHYAEAEVEYRTAIELDPNNVEYRVGYTHLLRYQERFEDALYEIQVAVDIDPNNRTAYNIMTSIRYQLNR